MKLGFDIDDTLINLREHAFHIYKRRLKKEVDISCVSCVGQSKYS